MWEMELMSNFLSCISKENATCFNPQVTLLSKYDFIVPGMGLKPSYCGMPYVNGIRDNYAGVHVAFTACKKMECPDCSDMWRLQGVFKNAVLIEAFARYSGSRPSRGNYSIHPDQEFTLEDIKKFNRNGKDRLLRQDIFAGVYVFHGFRIIKIVKKVIKKLTGDDSSSGQWIYILNEDNISVLNQHLPFKVRSWYDLVYLAPHNHFIGFPGNVLVNGDKKGKITITKEHATIDGKKVWELQNVEAVFKYIMYLSSHVSQLNNGSKSHLKVFNPFGELYKMKLLDLVSPEELHEIQASVLELINCRRTQKFEIKDGELAYAVTDKEEKMNFIPISYFRYNSSIGKENILKLINSVKESCPENAGYVTYLIEMFNNVLYSRDVPRKFKRLFVAPFECNIADMPDFVRKMDDRNPVKKMFIEGLKAPPDTFTFYFNSYLTEREQQYKDKFKPGTEVVNSRLKKPEFIDPGIDQSVRADQAVKPDIKIDEAFIAAMEKKILKLKSES